MFGLKGLSPEMLFGMAEKFGIDIYGLAEKKLPELLEKFVDLERKAGARLIVTISTSEYDDYFILCVYKKLEGNNLELYKSFPLNDIKSIIEQIKTAINNADNGETSFEPITAIEPATNGTGTGTDTAQAIGAAGTSGQY